MTLAARRGGERRSRTILMIPGASVLVLVVGWSVLWLVARNQAERIMDGWIAAEAARGRAWSCADREIGGFPFRIDLTCANPAFAGKVGGGRIEASLASLRARTFLYEPSTVEADLDGPLRVDSDDDRFTGSLAWSALHVTLRGLTADLKRAALTIDHPDLKLKTGDGAGADRFELHAGPALGRPIEDDADDVRLVLARAAIPAADALSGTSDRIDADVTAAVSKVSSAGMEPSSATLERWRESGGAVEVSSAVMSKGTLAATAAGTLRLDEAHRIVGRLETGLSGFEPLAARFGIPLRAATVGGALAHLLARNDAAPALPALPGGPPTLTLPIVLQDGRVLLGPFKTSVRLNPLY